MAFLLLPYSAFADPAEPDIVVVAPDASDPTRTPGAYTSLAIDETVPEGLDLPALLDEIPGAHVTRLGGLGAYSAVTLRGSTPRQVVVAVDGIPLNPDGGEAIDLSDLPVGALSRIEVWRGTPPPAFGVAPIGGVVNLVTREDDVVSATLSAGSHWSARQSAYAGGRVGDGAHARVFAQLASSANDFRYFDDNGTAFNALDDHWRRRSNAQHQAFDVVVTAHEDARGWRIGVLQAVHADDGGVPGPSTSGLEEVTLATTRSLTSFSTSGRLGPVVVSGRAWMLLRKEALDDPANELGRGDPEPVKAMTVGLQTGFSAAPVPWLVPSLVLSLRHETADLEPVDALGIRPPLRVGGAATVALDAHLVEDRLNLRAAARGVAYWDRSDAACTGDCRVVADVDPQASALVRATDWLSFKADVARGRRDPDLLERYGDRGGLVGNPALRPERGWQADGSVAVHQAKSRDLALTAEAGGWYAPAEDRIVLVQNAQNSLIPVNVGRSRTMGAELGLALSAWQHLDLGGSLTYTASEDRTAWEESKGKVLPRMPEWEVSLRTSAHLEERIRVGGTFSYSSATFLDTPNVVRSPARPYVGLFARTKIVPEAPSLEVDLLNLLGRQTAVVARNPLHPSQGNAVASVTDFAGYPLPGRTLVVSLRFETGTHP